MESRSRSRPGAFSIVELLVVLGLVVLLVGLALPALSRAREAGRRSACLSNLKQIGHALQGYRDDHGGRVPEAQTLPVDKYAPTLMDVLDPYLVQQKDIWRCPADGELFPAVGSSYEYFVGFYLTMIDLSAANATGKKNDLVRFFESAPSLAYVVINAEPWHPGGPGNVGRNALYLDGHVDWFALPSSSSASEGAQTP